MAVTQWTAIVRQCLLKRISPDELVHLLQTKQDMNAKAVFKSIIECRQSFCATRDPLPPRYLEAVLNANLVSLPDVLLVFIQRWNVCSPKRVVPADLASLEEIAMLIISSKYILDASDTSTSLVLASKWLTAIVNSINRDSSEVDPSISHLAEAVGSFLATLSATEAGVPILSEKKEGKKGMGIMELVAHAVEMTIGLFPAISAQLMDRLGVVQKHIAMINQSQSQPDPIQQSEMEALQFQASVVETRMMASRAGTVLYLEAMLLTGKTVDDKALFDFLEGRHSNDYTSMLLDILSSSFQVLKKSHDKEPGFSQVQSFIRNKLPSILSAIVSAPFSTLSSEEVISDAWPQIELSAVELMTCGQRFLHVCSLTDLISPEKANQLIGDTSLTFTKNLQSKEDVIAQVNNGHTRPAKLADHLVQTDGSAAAISQAIVEIILTYCQNKETHHLKDLANAMIRSPNSINTLALFVRPSYWLSPMCSLLDEWRWNEIHGESQPLYDEFGSVLLLILASKRRLSLSKNDIGMTNPSGFVSHYLDQEGTERALQDFTDDSKSLLGDWINALYVAEVLSDDLTTTCSPQEFYLFIPTLLRQSLLAFQAGKLSQDVLKVGLEYLLTPFLLPSLVSALSWLNAFDDAGTLMLPIFVKAPETDEAARGIHQTILSMNALSFSFESKPAMTLDSFQGEVIACVTSSTETNLPAALEAVLRTRGIEASLAALLNALLHFSGSTEFLFALDIVATLTCTADRRLRHLLLLKHASLGMLIKKSPITAEAIVHLHRRVQAYASVLVVQEVGMDFTTLQLANIEATAANMEVAPTQDVQTDQPMDDIDQVLNESAAMSMDQGDTGLDIDDFYGLQNDMGNLDDLDLEMFQ